MQLLNKKIAYIWFITLVIFISISQLFSFHKNIELWLEDIRIALFTPIEEQSDDIVIVTLNEELLETFPYRTPIDRDFLNDLVDTLIEKKVKMIGIDLLFDQPTEKQKDIKLKNTLNLHKNILSIAYADQKSGLTKKQVNFLDQYLPQDTKGWVNLVKSTNDNVVRWSYTGSSQNKSFVNLILQKLNMSPNYSSERIYWLKADNNDSFKKYPAQSINLLPDTWFEDKIVLIGVNLALEDRHETPLSLIKSGYGRNITGVEIQAHILAQMIDSKKIHNPHEILKVFIITVSAFIGFFSVFINVSQRIKLSLIPVITLFWWGGSIWLFYQYQILIPLLTPTISLICNTSLALFIQNSLEKKQRHFVQSAFSKYVSPAIVEHLIKNPEELKISGERRELSYIFTDIAGFTTTSEENDAEDVSKVLNDYLDGVCKIIIKHDGMVNDFIGDAVFAIFNAPIHQNDHREQAISCAKEIDEFAIAFGQTGQAQKLDLGITRIGVHTGESIVGNFGSSEYFKYTSIGDAVNTASRIEGLNKFFNTKICISENAVTESINENLLPIGHFIMKGKTKPLLIYTLIDKKENSWIGDYRQAFYALNAKDKSAYSLFEKLPHSTLTFDFVNYFSNRVQNNNYSTIIKMENK